MIKLFKARRDYKKVDSVINSCETLGQINTAANLVHNYFKVYGFGNLWRKLDKKVYNIWTYHVDLLDYQDRLEDLERENN